MAEKSAMPSRLSERDVLVAARKVIEDPESWAHGEAFVPETGQRCAAMAISVANDNKGHYDAACSAVFKAATGEAPTHTAPALALGDWNDASERTHAEVLAAFDKAIAEASDGK
jgi:hypothetical protein